MLQVKVSDKHTLYGFLKSVEAFGDRPAVEVSGEVLTYAALFVKAASLAATLVQYEVGCEQPLTAVFAYRSVTAFTGVLAVLLRGHGYVPLNRTFPPERTGTMLARSGCKAMVVDSQSEKQLAQVLDGIDHELLIVLPERGETDQLAARWPKHHFVGAGQLVPAERWSPADVSSDSIAYLLFTSGSTGAPKGVMVAHRNVRPFIEFVAERFSVSDNDRVSQTSDMTFDFSVADIFVAWERGACVCCPPGKTLINPGQFINDSRLTIWFSVPSMAVFMKRLGALKADAYPRLRVSMFCGEGLPVEIANAWAKAAPNSIIENFYGPTELAVACTYYRWDSNGSLAQSLNGLVPIGEPFPGMLPLVVDESLNEVKSGEDGELLVAGPQLCLGYWRDPATTAAAFVKPPGRSETYYRTGDRIRKPQGDEPMLYLGRVDNQIKILGHRVELSEVEAVVREESALDDVVAVGWPRTSSGAGGVEVFLQSEDSVPPDLNDRVSKRLPMYMVPRRFHYLPQIPLNDNGKYDRESLIRYLENLP